ncbi:hypothetical protein PRUPE_1G583100 [Prunus persica]|uniref:Uncharacterized protein n=1 Tax=Prunus persica TaxID=3760 RepID=A0A251RK34_PRUPE|nr:hypothetical protein PRUPE_1G583100 [Prunus persica]
MTNMSKIFPSDLCQQALGILHHRSYDGPFYGVTSKCCNDLESITFKDNILTTPFSSPILYLFLQPKPLLVAQRKH